MTSDKKAMRTLALDFGTKRIGLALSDASGTFAEPFDVLANSPDVLSKLLKICDKEGVERLVVGLPLNMDSTASWMTKASLDFGQRLAAATKLPLVFVDERLSSFEAEQGLIDRKRSGEKLTRLDKKSRLDALSAAHFLREFLEGRLSPIDPAPFHGQT
jgi:putative Holliday junction resolvase